MPMENDTAVIANYSFRGIEYVVTMNLISSQSLLVEVEDKLTADQWRGTFEAAYVEELTHKTGNYKQFSVFTNMLESAILQNSDSVALDLLTYADLESLRDRKMVATGAGTKHIVGARSTNLNAKRYLILTYTVEFDRIHYPLPLPYMGKPDPRALQDSIRQMRQQIKVLKQQVNKDYKHKELEKLRKDYTALQRERDELEADGVEFRRQVAQTGRGGAAKEIRALKDVIRSLEEDVVTERTKQQRAAARRAQQCRQLADEVDELKASERNLRVRVKNLTNELALHHRQRGKTNTSSASLGRGDASSRWSTGRDRSSGRDRSTGRDRSSSREDSRLSAHSRASGVRSRTALSDRSPAWQRPRSRGRPEARQAARERPPSRERFRSSSRESGRQVERSPSAAGARCPRFNPTAYIKEKDRLQKESSLKEKRNIRRQLSAETLRPTHNFNDRRNVRARGSSAGSGRSRGSSIESLSDIGVVSDASRHSRQSRKEKHALQIGQRSNGWSSPDTTHRSANRNKTRKILVSTPDKTSRSHRRRDKENLPEDVADYNNKYADRSADLSEIDARLNRLQQFMKDNLP